MLLISFMSPLVLMCISRIHVARSSGVNSAEDEAVRHERNCDDKARKKAKKAAKAGAAASSTT